MLNETLLDFEEKYKNYVFDEMDRMIKQDFPEPEFYLLRSSKS
jgi:hypothetical protein